MKRYSPKTAASLLRTRAVAPYINLQGIEQKYHKKLADLNGFTSELLNDWAKRIESNNLKKAELALTLATEKHSVVKAYTESGLMSNYRSGWFQLFRQRPTPTNLYAHILAIELVELILDMEP